MKPTYAILLSLPLLAGAASAGVTLDFATDAQGVTSVDWNTANGGTAWSPNHGGSLAVTVGTPDWTNPLVQINMTMPALGTEFLEALDKGGTVSFDYIVDQADFTGYDAGAPPSYFQMVVVGNSDEAAGGGWDQNVLTGSSAYSGGIPAGPTTVRVTMGLTAGAPADDTNASYGVGSGYNEFLIGFNSEPGSFTSAVVYLDNFEVAAVPEASTALLGAIGAIGFATRRRRQH